MVVRDGFVVGETRGAKVLGGATTPLVTSFVGGDILDTGPSTVTAGCGETVSAWFATRCNREKTPTTSLLGGPRNYSEFSCVATTFGHGLRFLENVCIFVAYLFLGKDAFSKMTNVILRYNYRDGETFLSARERGPIASR